jgi:4-alpha-glucanotransferase
VLATTDDLAGQVERPNQPGTTGAEHPNWRIRLPVDTADLLTTSPGREVIAALVAAREARTREQAGRSDNSS